MVDDLLTRIDDAVSDWEARPESWVPGDPLHTDPRWDGTDGRQVVRPMFELLDDEPFTRARCERCDVRWVGDDPCFVCGRQVAGAEALRPPAVPVVRFVAVDLDPFVRALQQIREASLPLARILAGLAAALDQPDPPGRPRPLPIDGREYARRRKSRGRR